MHGGTGSGAYFGKDIAGKTGTTEDNNDAWFVGFTPNGYTTAVWMGYDNAAGAPPRFMNSVHGRVVFGGTFPATIWRKYMQGITDGMDVGSFADPKSFPGKVLNTNLTTTTTTAPSRRRRRAPPPRRDATSTSSAPPTTAAHDDLDADGPSPRRRASPPADGPGP